MADLSVTANKVGNARPDFSIVISMVAAVAITRGQGVYVDSNGKAALADGSAAGTAVCIGLALQDVSIGQTVDVLVLGFISGFDLSAVAYNTLLKVSDTAGAIDNGAGAPTVDAEIGRVVGLSDGDITKVIFVNCLHNLNNVPA